MKFKNILVLYKRSAYKIYFLEKRSSLRDMIRSPFFLKQKASFKRSHDAHYGTLRSIAKTLFSLGIPFHESYRGRGVNYNNYDLVITVGGDGTFLEAARHLNKQILLGVNSAPQFSVGRFCIATAQNFEKVIKETLHGKHKVGYLQRLRVIVDGHDKHVDALNDILICHKNPAVLCRYHLSVKGTTEEQRSSGIWVATPAGSTGAIKSAGGKIIKPYTKKFQYMPRELYVGHNGKYKLKGHVLTGRETIKIVSLMREGMLYCDGAHYHVPFHYGSKAHVSLSPNPIKTIVL